MAAAAAAPPPLRVVSLLPSATDTVVALGLAHLLVGRSHECDSPEAAHVAAITDNKLGDTTGLSSEEVDAAAGASGAALWQVAFMPGADTRALAALEWGLAVYRTRLDALAALRPDVVLTQVQAASGALSVADAQTSLRALCGSAPVRIVQLDAESLDSAWAEVAAVGAALGAAAKGEALAGWCRARVSAVTSAARGRGPPRRVAVVQWAAPLFIAGGWVPELVRAAGGVDACAVPPGGASLALQPQQLAAASPDVLLLAICGVGVEAAAAEAPALAAALGADAWAALPAVRRGAVVAADAVRLFSRAGPALADTAELLLEVLWPEAQPHGHEGSAWRRVTVNADALQQQCQAASAGNAADSSAEASRERAADREFAYV